MISHMFPRPVHFYQLKAFAGQRYVPTDAGIDPGRITLLGVDERHRNRILSQLAILKFSHAGTLRGEYAVLFNGLIAISRDGVPIKLNTSADDDHLHSSLFSQIESICTSDAYTAQRNAILAGWEQLPRLRGAALLAEIYADHNFYHFHINLLPKVRYVDGGLPVAVSSAVFERPFQRELIERGWAGRQVVRFSQAVVIEDPVLVHAPFRADAVAWLRAATGFRARKGRRRIYVARRGTLGRRHHGALRETPEFLRFLAENGFETIDFGTGDVPVARQVAMLDGAAVVLSAHGANLTNIAYLDPGVSVIELLPVFWEHVVFMEVALAAGLNYVGVVCERVVEDLGIEADVPLLVDALERALAAAA